MHPTSRHHAHDAVKPPVPRAQLAHAPAAHEATAARVDRERVVVVPPAQLAHDAARSQVPHGDPRHRADGADEHRPAEGEGADASSPPLRAPPAAAAPRPPRPPARWHWSRPRRHVPQVDRPPARAAHKARRRGRRAVVARPGGTLRAIKGEGQDWAAIHAPAPWVDHEGWAEDAVLHRLRRPTTRGARGWVGMADVVQRNLLALLKRVLWALPEACNRRDRARPSNALTRTEERCPGTTTGRWNSDASGEWSWQLVVVSVSVLLADHRATSPSRLQLSRRQRSTQLTPAIQLRDSPAAPYLRAMASLHCRRPTPPSWKKTTVAPRHRRSRWRPRRHRARPAHRPG